MDSQIVQDLLPGTGSMGSVPQHHDYKRAVIMSAPKVFTVEVLPPRKFGSGYCYGLHISPVVPDGGDNRSLKSSRTGSSINTDYEIWRRWEDCLWFQDLLETEYKLMARTKRTRLAQGKGVKKDGMYIRSDQAASFESLPPGPDVNDIAKNLHDILPKLTKKGTIFRAGQATIEQRGREFADLIDALFQDNVPTLINELRENRIIRDFFGYWRRDKDHDRKMNEQPTSNRMSRTSITSSAFSMYFSSSNMSLSLPGAFAHIPPTPSLPQHVKETPRKGKKVLKAASFTSTSSSSSRSSGSSGSSRSPRTPVSAPAGMSFTVDAAGSLIPTSPVPHDDPYDQHAGPSSAPLRSSSSQWSLRSSKASPFGASVSESQDGAILFVPDSPWVDSFDTARSGGLQPLPEEQELVPAISRMTISGPSSSPRRPRNYSCPDPAVRNCLVFAALSEEPVSDPVSPAEDPYVPYHNAAADIAPDTPMTQTDSSRRSSVALTSFSGEHSRPSSWRTSIASLSDIPGDLGDAEFDMDDFLCMSPDMSPVNSYFNDESTIKPSHRLHPSVTTMNSIVSNSSVDAVLPRRPISPPLAAELRRPMSTGSLRSVAAEPTLSVPESGSWEEQQEDLIDAYFYDPGLPHPAPPVTPPLSGQVTPRRERASTFQVSTPDRFPKPFQNRPPGQFHLPWTPVKAPRMSVASSLCTANGTDTFTIKAVRQDTIVLLRATYSMSLVEVRHKIRTKFSSQDGPPLTDAFTIGVAPLSFDEDQSTLGRPRSQSASALRQEGHPRLRFLCTEDDWEAVVSASTGKLTLHIFDRF